MRAADGIRLKLAVFDGERNRRRCTDGAELIAHAGGFRAGRNLFAHLTFDFARVRQYVFERAVFFQQFHGGLFANAGDTGDVVGIVAHETFQVTHAVGFQAVLLLEHGAVKLNRFADALFRHEHVRVIVDELQRVPISGYKQRVDAFCLALSCKRA